MCDHVCSVHSTAVPVASDTPTLVCHVTPFIAQVLKAHCLKERKAGKKKKKKVYKL